MRDRGSDPVLTLVTGVSIAGVFVAIVVIAYTLSVARTRRRARAAAAVVATTAPVSPRAIATAATVVRSDAASAPPVRVAADAALAPPPVAARATHIAADGAVPAPDASALRDELPDEPRFAARATLRDAVTARVAACDALDPGHRRHARVAARYDGATGRATDVRIAGSHFAGTPLGACIERTVRDVAVARFARATWSTDFVFMMP